MASHRSAKNFIREIKYSRRRIHTNYPCNFNCFFFLSREIIYPSFISIIAHITSRNVLFFLLRRLHRISFQLELKPQSLPPLPAIFLKETAVQVTQSCAKRRRARYQNFYRQLQTVEKNSGARGGPACTPPTALPPPFSRFLDPRERDPRGLPGCQVEEREDSASSGRDPRRFFSRDIVRATTLPPICYCNLHHYG